MNGRAIAGLVALAVSLGLSSIASAQELAAVRDADPMELARVVRELGDPVVLERLGDATPQGERLAATRAARFLHAPELALERLAELAAGRDPWLSEAAAAALLAIADALDPSGMARREHGAAPIEAALPHLDRLVADEAARPDLRAVAEHVARQLRALAVD
ncbi:MAG: hypothetical protein AB7S26_15575 [Sandaracinaceae bacterium]